MKTKTRSLSDVLAALLPLLDELAAHDDTPAGVQRAAVELQCGIELKFSRKIRVWRSGAKEGKASVAHKTR